MCGLSVIEETPLRQGLVKANRTRPSAVHWSEEGKMSDHEPAEGVTNSDTIFRGQSGRRLKPCAPRVRRVRNLEPARMLLAHEMFEISRHRERIRYDGEQGDTRYLALFTAHQAGLRL